MIPPSGGTQLGLNHDKRQDCIKQNAKVLPSNEMCPNINTVQEMDTACEKFQFRCPAESCTDWNFPLENCAMVCCLLACLGTSEA